MSRQARFLFVQMVSLTLLGAGTGALGAVLARANLIQGWLALLAGAILGSVGALVLLVRRLFWRMDTLHRKLLTKFGRELLSSQQQAERGQRQAATAAHHAQVAAQLAAEAERLARQATTTLRESDRVAQETLRQARAAAHDARLTASHVVERPDFPQVEALFTLHSAFRPRAPMPTSRGWAASPDLCLELVRQVLTRRPRLVVEFGSGLSTLWLAYALEQVGEGAKLVSVDHDPHYGARTTADLEAHGLTDIAEVRIAPLTTTPMDGESVRWYDPTVLADLEDIDLVVVDGPPGSTAPQARYPAVPLLRNKLTSDAVIVLDDCERTDERAILDRWRTLLPESELSMLEHEKQTAVLQLSLPDTATVTPIRQR